MKGLHTSDVWYFHVVFSTLITSPDGRHYTARVSHAEREDFQTSVYILFLLRTLRDHLHLSWELPLSQKPTHSNGFISVICKCTCSCVCWIFAPTRATSHNEMQWQEATTRGQFILFYQEWERIPLPVLYNALFYVGTQAPILQIIIGLFTFSLAAFR